MYNLGFSFCTLAICRIELIKRINSHPRLCCCTFADAGVASAQTAPLLAMAVQPDAEHHEDDPTCRSNPGDKGRLLYHVRDLLRECVFWVHYGLSHLP